VTVDPSDWVCPAPLRDHPQVVLGHGGGGRLSADLIEHLFVPAFGADGELGRLGDGATLPRPGGRIAVSTDSFVVRPLFFPGGCIGDLAVNGTVNDLAMCGARPGYLAVSIVLEEGLPLADLGRIVAAMAAAAEAAGVRIVTGDTKVVDRGHGDGVYVTTTGVGVVADDVEVGPDRIRPGDAVICSGPIARHGIAVLSVREGLEFGSSITSDSAPLAAPVADLLAAAEVHALRDPTRGGVAASLNELAVASAVGIAIEERAIPVDDDVRAACGFLGLDPLAVANEGVLLAFVPASEADAALDALRAHPTTTEARIIGEAVEQHPGTVVVRTALGAQRVLPLPLAEQLPRIC
jgi:hydrogenase expression/formation protein HypE